MPPRFNDTWDFLGVGSYGIIISKDGDKTCRKLFTRSRAVSFLRESYMIRHLSHISGITEIVNLDVPTLDDIEIVRSRNLDLATFSASSRKHRLDKECWGVIVMKRYKITLSDWLRSRPTYHDRIFVLTKIIRIMTEIHNNGVIHGDIKLENIMLTNSGDVRIIDWGLSGTKGSACIYGTTKIYRPKVIIQDFCHDIYSLGVLSVELILGSVMVNTPEYGPCLRLLDSVTIDPKLRKLITKMLHPDCSMRPDINQVFLSFQIHTTPQLFRLSLGSSLTRHPPTSFSTRKSPRNLTPVSTSPMTHPRINNTLSRFRRTRSNSVDSRDISEYPSSFTSSNSRNIPSDKLVLIPSLDTYYNDMVSKNIIYPLCFPAARPNPNPLSTSSPSTAPRVSSSSSPSVASSSSPSVASSTSPSVASSTSPSVASSTSPSVASSTSPSVASSTSPSVITVGDSVSKNAVRSMGNIRYPEHFKLFLDKRPEMAQTITCILISLYHPSIILKMSDLLKYIDYSHVLSFIDSI